MPDEHHADNDSRLTDNESRILDSMIGHAMLSAQMSSSMPLPWETGIMASIFGDEPLANLPGLPDLQRSIPGFGHLEPDDDLEDLAKRIKKRRGETFCVILYERAISFSNTLTDKELDDPKWNRALEKLYTVMISSPGIKPEGLTFKDDDMELNFRQIKILCGARSPNTVTEQANSLVKFCLWHKGYYYRRHAIPCSDIFSSSSKVSFWKRLRYSWSMTLSRG